MTHTTANAQVTVELYVADASLTLVAGDPGDILDTAFNWGQEDALSGNPMAGSLYFVVASNEWFSYNNGFEAGIKMRNMLGTSLTSDEANLTAIASIEEIEAAQRADERAECDRQRNPFRY